MKQRLAVILSHPIQYYSPLFKMLNERGALDLKVFYTLGKLSRGDKFDHGFGKSFDWDIPLLEGYPYEILENISKEPKPFGFNGIINPDIIKRIENYNPDVILVFGWAFKSHLKVLRYFRNKVPVLFRGDSTILDDQQFLKKKIRTWVLRWVYKHIDIALYVGKSNYDYYLQFGLKKEQLMRAPHAIDNDRFSQHKNEYQAKAADIRRQLEIEASAFVFLFAGKLEPKKDPGLLLDAFLKCDFPASVHLLLVGDGVLESEIKLQAAGNNNVHFMNFQNQTVMPAVYRTGDVFILPSRGPEETWGLAVNEAMACERPIIVSDKCGCAVDLVNNGVNGFMFEAGNMIDLKQKMQVIYSDKQLLPVMGKASVDKIQEYSFQSICKAVENIIVKE